MRRLNEREQIMMEFRLRDRQKVIDRTTKELEQSKVEIREKDRSLKEKDELIKELLLNQKEHQAKVLDAQKEDQEQAQSNIGALQEGLKLLEAKFAENAKKTQQMISSSQGSRISGVMPGQISLIAAISSQDPK